MNKSSVATLKLIEQNFDVNALRFRGVAVWPIIRGLLVFDFQKDFADDPHQTAAFDLRDAAGNIAKRAELFARDTNALHARGEDPKELLRPVDILLISSAEYRSELADNRYYNKHLDSLRYFLSPHYSCATLEWSLKKTHNRPSVYPLSTLDHLIGLSSLQKHIALTQERLFDAVEPVERLEQLLEFLRAHGLKTRYNAQLLRWHIVHIFILKAHFTALLHRIDPKAIIMQYYVTLPHFALLLAAKESGIHTFDLQHGAMGEHNGIYFHYEHAVPQEGYAVLPDTFLTWDTRTQKRIRHWSDKTPAHDALSIGNPWITRYMEDVQMHRKLSFINDEKPTVLLSLQPLEDFLPEWIRQVMIATKEDIQWLVRLHPSHPSMPRYIEHMEKALAALRNEGVDTRYEEATRAKLFDLLRHTDLHMTSHSTVAFEALEFGVPSLLFGDFCFDYMAKELQRGVFTRVNTAKELQLLLSSKKKRDALNRTSERGYYDKRALKKFISQTLPSILAKERR